MSSTPFKFVNQMKVLVEIIMWIGFGMTINVRKGTRFIEMCSTIMYVAQLFNTYAQKIQRTSLQLTPYVIISRQGIPIHVAGIGSRG